MNAGDQPQELFAVQGPTEGEHDPGIPQRYFEIAPAKLSEPDMEALRVSRKPSSSYAAHTVVVSVCFDATIWICYVPQEGPRGG